MAIGLLIMSLSILPGLLAYGIDAYGTYQDWKYRSDLKQQIHQAMANQPDGQEDPDAIDRAATMVSRSIPRQRPAPGLVWTEMLSAAIFLVAYNAGLILLTSFENRYPDRLKAWRIASWIAAGAAGFVLLTVVAGAFNEIVQAIWATLVKLVAIASAIITWGYLRQLAKRIPHSTLARICAWLLLIPLLSFLKVFPFLGLWLIYEFAFAMQFLLVFYLPAAAVLLIIFANIFRRAAVSAEKSWQSETALTR